MTKKDAFIKEIKEIIAGGAVLSEDAKDYFEVMFKETEKKAFTDNGKIVLKFMRDNKDDYHNLFQSKSMEARVGLSSRTISGAMRKLKDDGYVESLGGKPATYAITDLGEAVEII